MNARQTRLFDRLPDDAPAKAKKSSIPVVGGDALGAEVTAAIEAFLAAQAKKAEADEGIKETKPVIIAAGRTILDHMARGGSFSKSVKLALSEDVMLTVTQADKFSVKSGTTMNELKEAFGAEFAKEHFSLERRILIKPEVLTTRALLEELIALVGASNFSKFFSKEDDITVSPGFDQAVYTLPEDKYALATAGLVKRNEVSIR